MRLGSGGAGARKASPGGGAKRRDCPVLRGPGPLEATCRVALLVAGVAGLRGVMRGPCGWALRPHVDGARSTAACADIRPQIGGTAPPSERSGLRVSQTRFFEAADRPETLMQSTMIDSASTNSEPDWLDRAAYPFQHQYLELPEGRIHYVDEGQGEPVVFVHGTPTWSFEFRHLIRAVRGTHRAIALDHFGFGLSDRPEAFPYTPEAHAEVFAEFVERLGLTRFALVVHDIGGPIALPVALERPERISRLVVMNSFMWPLDADKELAKNARFAASELGRMLYRHVNASLRIVMPNAYFDRQKLTA